MTTGLTIQTVGIGLKSVLLTGTILEMNLQRESDVTVAIDAGDIHLM